MLHAVAVFKEAEFVDEGDDVRAGFMVVLEGKVDRAAAFWKARELPRAIALAVSTCEI